MAKALITGITGQDGSYLTEQLLEEGFEVHGIVRRTSSLDRSRLSELYRDPEIYGRRLFLHYADLDDQTTLRRILHKTSPDEVYHLAGQSHVGLSFEIPESTCDLTAMGTLRLLEMIRDMGEPARFYHASSSEVFGRPDCPTQDEKTPFAPVTPYGCAKAFATQMVKVYRDSFDLFAVNGIMFNHESTRRGENFVTRKICRAAAEIKAGLREELMLGDLDAQRDWGFAPDYVRGMRLALRHETAEDYIFATGVLHSVRDVVGAAFGAVGLDWENCVKKDPRFIRPAEPIALVGDASKAKRLLGWDSRKPFEDFIAEMTEAELAALRSQGG